MPLAPDPEVVDDERAAAIAEIPRPPAEGIPSEDDPRYGGVILIALMEKANHRIKPGAGLRAWLDDLTPEQRLAVLLQKATSPREFFRRGWGDQVPRVNRVLRGSAGNVASALVARGLEKVAPILQDHKPGQLLSDDDDALVSRVEGRIEKVSDHYRDFLHGFFHRLWVLSDHGHDWEDWD